MLLGWSPQPVQPTMSNFGAICSLSLLASHPLAFVPVGSSPPSPKPLLVPCAWPSEDFPSTPRQLPSEDNLLTAEQHPTIPALLHPSKQALLIVVQLVPPGLGAALQGGGISCRYLHTVNKSSSSCCSQMRQGARRWRPAEAFSSRLGVLNTCCSSPRNQAHTPTRRKCRTCSPHHDRLQKVGLWAIPTTMRPDLASQAAHGQVWSLFACQSHDTHRRDWEGEKTPHRGRFLTADQYLSSQGREGPVPKGKKASVSRQLLTRKMINP